jgi:hypothetical protein
MQGSRANLDFSANEPETLVHADEAETFVHQV